MPMTRADYDPRNRWPHDLGPTTYDPYKLIRDVLALLEDQGLRPEIDVRPEVAIETEKAARALLHGLGIQDGIAVQDKLDLDGGARYDSRMHGD